MPPKRPTPVTVLGILSIVFSSLGLMSNLCCGVGLLVFAGMITQAGADNPQLLPLKDFIDGINRAAPGLMAYFVTLMVAGTILSAMLLIGGIGLLQMKNWARVLCILVAVLQLLLQAGNFIYNTAVIQPAVMQAQQQMLAQAGARPPPANPFGNTALSAFTSIIGVAFYIVLLVFLLQPRIVAAFHRRNVPGEAPVDDVRTPPSVQRHDDDDSTAFRSG
jgi:hypothetical protein